MSLYFDTHAHLLDAPMTLLNHPTLCVTTDSNQWLSALQYAQSCDYFLPAIGLHPWFVSVCSEQDIADLEQLIQAFPIAALGEIGLDFSLQYKMTRMMQLEVFEQQLELALNFRLPVSIHVVKAHNEMLSLLKQYPVKGVIHGLGSSLQIAHSYLSLGMKIGVNGILCRPNARRYQQMVQQLPLDSFVLETDFPNIHFPEQKAALNDIEQVARRMACLTDKPLSEILDCTYNTASEIFLRNPYEPSL